MKLTKVKMLSTQMGSLDGLSTMVFKKDHAYEINDSLLQCFIELGAVLIIGLGEKAIAPPENRAIAGAPENKQEPVMCGQAMKEELPPDADDGRKFDVIPPKPARRRGRPRREKK